MSTGIGITTDERSLRGLDGVFYGDPTTRFCERIHAASINLDRRSVSQLARDGRELDDAVMREQALYQLVALEGEAALPTIREALAHDPDPDLRINMLWALEWIGSPECRSVCRTHLETENGRVLEWARVFAWEMGWSPEDFRRAREYRYYSGRTFDQTIYLHIMCNLYVRLNDGGSMWGHILLSPQMLARVYGQALACPVIETRDREIVISKTLEGLHADGSDHYETFLFRGFTEKTNPLSGNFYFETQTKRPFFLSGRANDASQGVVEDIIVPFAREGQWFLNENIEIKGAKAIEYVRGLFQGWAFVNLERMMERVEDVFFPGNSVLSTLHHPEVGPKTNTFLNGRFKGKVVDWTGDGALDLNYLPAHATRAGEVDSNLDGQPDEAGVTVSRNPAT